MSIERDMLNLLTDLCPATYKRPSRDPGTVCAGVRGTAAFALRRQGAQVNRRACGSIGWECPDALSWPPSTLGEIFLY